MKCPKCNESDHESGAKFCHVCGTRLTNPIASPNYIEESPKKKPSLLGVKAIDLGLPSGTKWASCNVGATKPEEYGGYYAWGETEEKSKYDDFTYNNTSEGDISGTQDDVAHVKWGDNWQLPSSDQIQELVDNCIFSWSSLNGINGAKFIGPNGNSIFFPAAGYRGGYNVYGLYGFYWAGKQNPHFNDYASGLEFFSDLARLGNDVRTGGHTIRPVYANI